MNTSLKKALDNYSYYPISSIFPKIEQCSFLDIYHYVINYDFDTVFNCRFYNFKISLLKELANKNYQTVESLKRNLSFFNDKYLELLLNTDYIKKYSNEIVWNVLNNILLDEEDIVFLYNFKKTKIETLKENIYRVISGYKIYNEYKPFYRIQYLSMYDIAEILDFLKNVKNNLAKNKVITYRFLSNNLTSKIEPGRYLINNRFIKAVSQFNLEEF